MFYHFGSFYLQRSFLRMIRTFFSGVWRIVCVVDSHHLRAQHAWLSVWDRFFVFLCVQRYILKPRLCGQHFKIYHMCERSFSVPVSHHCDPVRTDQCFQLWRVQKCLLWKKTNWFFWPFTMSWCSASVFQRIWSISAAPSLQGERFNFIVRKADVCWMSGVQVVFVPDVTGFNYIRLNNVHDIVSTI